MSTPKLISTRSRKLPDICQRVSLRPILAPSDVAPSDPRLAVIGVLNAAFLHIGGRPFLVVRVDERPPNPQHLKQSNGFKTLDVPYFSLQRDRRPKICRVQVPTAYSPDKESVLPLSARRPQQNSRRPSLLLCFISHLRLAELRGDVVDVQPAPALSPSNQFTRFGCEDPRATSIGGTPLVTFTGIGDFGATSWVCQFSDKAQPYKCWMLQGPDHKHSALFPAQISGKYIMLTRPLTRSTICRESIWIQASPDLMNWGPPSPLIEPRRGFWDSERVGPGPSPIRIPRGWLLLYYGVDREQSYHLGAAILDHDNPLKVTARTKAPILSPTLKWERIGRRADTIFACGARLMSDGKTIRIYYGAADMYVGAADLDLADLEEMLERTK